MTNTSELTRELMGKVAGDIAGAGAIRLLVIGDELGLFKDLADNGPATSEELAARLDLNERYVREWIYGISAAGYLAFDKVTRKVAIPEENIPVLATECGPQFMGGTVTVVHELLKPYADVIEAFKRGGGVQYEAYAPGMWTNLERHSCVRYTHLLTKEWMHLMPEVSSRLEAGGSCADFGCGAGGSTIELAKMFPAATFVGFDLVEKNVELAMRKAQRAGLSDRVTFRRFDFADGSPGRYDVVATFDVIHDMAHPEVGLRVLRDSVEDDGVYVLMDVACEEDPADNEGPMAVFKFCASLHFCMTTAMAGGGEGLGTCGLPDSKVAEMCRDAGWSATRRVPIDHPFNSLFVVSP